MGRLFRYTAQKPRYVKQNLIVRTAATCSSAAKPCSYITGYAKNGGKLNIFKATHLFCSVLSYH